MWPVYRYYANIVVLRKMSRAWLIFMKREISIFELQYTIILMSICKYISVVNPQHISILLSRTLFLMRDNNFRNSLNEIKNFRVSVHV